MDWLNRLLAVDAPAGTSLHSAQWTLRGLLPGWAMVLPGPLSRLRPSAVEGATAQPASRSAG